MSELLGLELLTSLHEAPVISLLKCPILDSTMANLEDICSHRWWFSFTLSEHLPLSITAWVFKVHIGTGPGGTQLLTEQMEQAL